MNAQQAPSESVEEVAAKFRASYQREYMADQALKIRALISVLNDDLFTSVESCDDRSITCFHLAVDRVAKLVASMLNDDSIPDKEHGRCVALEGKAMQLHSILCLIVRLFPDIQDTTTTDDNRLALVNHGAWAFYASVDLANELAEGLCGIANRDFNA